MREREIEKYLHQQVTLAGGTTRKRKGRVNDPDRIVIWPRIVGYFADIHFVELKAPGKRARAGQEREHKRLRALGCVVEVLDTKEKIDNYVRRNK